MGLAVQTQLVEGTSSTFSASGGRGLAVQTLLVEGTSSTNSASGGD